MVWFKVETSFWYSASPSVLVECSSSGAAAASPMKALIRNKVSNINACLYCSAHQVRVMESQGVAREKIDNMYDYLSHPAFSDKERAILAYCEALTLDAGAISEDVVATFMEHTTAQERTEVTIVAAAMGLLNRLNDGLRVPLEEPMLEIASGISFEPK